MSGGNEVNVNNATALRFLRYVSPDGGLEDVSIIITDVYGKTMAQKERSEIDLSSFDAGVYFIELNTPSSRYVQKVVKQ